MNHLELLRNEHLQLQTRYAELQRRYDILEAARVLRCVENGECDTSTNPDGDSFVKRLLDTVVHLYNKDLYSDITIHFDGRQLRGHRFVLAARTDFWGDLSNAERIELNDISFSVGQILLKWIYTDSLDDHLGDSYILDLLSAALKFQLENLKLRCEALLISRLEVDNSCFRKMERFQPEHFKDMSAPLLYKMLKRRSKHVLNSIIGLEREDVLFLYLIENDSKLVELLNQPDDLDILPLELSFETSQLNIAKSLVEHGADLNKLDANGLSFLWKAIQKGKIDVCEFLVNHGANVDYVNKDSGDTLLHILAKSKMKEEAVGQWASSHIDRFEVNALDINGRTPLMVAIQWGNEKIFNLIVKQEKADANIKDLKYKTALEMALLDKNNLDMAEELVQRKADVNAMDSKDQTLFHKAVCSSNFAAIQFLAKHGADVNKPNSNGSTPLHLFLHSLPAHGEISPTHLDILTILLKSGADPIQRETSSGVFQSPKLEQGKGQGLPLSVLDKEGRSPLWCSLLAGKFDTAKLLLDAGADVNEKSTQENSQPPLLIRAIQAKRDDITRFLLDNKAIAAVTSPDGFTCLNLAVEEGLTPTVDYLCKLGANLNHPNPKTKLIPLWTALQKGDYGTAEVLVGHGSDTEGWAPSDEQSVEEETLLHRAIDQCNQKAAVFLIKSGCNVNALRRLRDPGELVAAASPTTNGSPKSTTSNLPNLRQTPLHISVQWGLADVSKALISNLNCKIDAQDCDGRTAAHIAVMEQDQATLDLLLSHPDPSALGVRDRYGQTPLALAMKHKYNKAAEAICQRLPHAAVQVNGSGENLLHCAVKANDLESVLFLLGLQVDVNIATQDQDRLTALHICAQIGSELVLRNLLLAGAEVNSQNAHGQTALHLAAMGDHSDLCTVLLDNAADPNILDVEGNNALHSAVSQGAANSTQLLLLESNVDYFAANKKRQNIMHLCAINVGIVSAEVFLTILEVHPNFPLEIPDMYGNTLFLLSFLNANAELCRLALKNGACMGVVNHHGQTVFNIDTPTKQLLFGLLDGLEREPRWAEGEQCSECEAKFTLTMRKHHCRHCGRLVCAKCSEHQMPIVKYNLAKNVRVCQICYDVLTMGASNTTAITNQGPVF
uniref:Ankyrin repeat and FYVE domain-containing protein 1 n=1 Tax=Ditylenchus dipsaci TaxID=166011 RepID=A0A915DVL8_9BILA